MKNGFTMLELMVVIGIFAFLMTLSVPSYHAIQQNISVKSDVQEGVNNLRLAQNRALVSQGGTNHGVYFLSDKYIIYAGENFSTAALKQTITLKDGISVYSGSGGEVNFQRLTGATIPLTVTIGTDPGDANTIFIDKNGKVEVTD